MLTITGGMGSFGALNFMNGMGPFGAIQICDLDLVLEENTALVTSRRLLRRFTTKWKFGKAIVTENFPENKVMSVLENYYLEKNSSEWRDDPNAGI